MWNSREVKDGERVTPGRKTALTPLESPRHRFVPLEGDFVERCRQRMPARPGAGLGTHDVRFGHHPHGTPAKRPVHQANLDFYRSSRLNPPRTEEKDSARTDIGRAQDLLFLLSLPRDAIQAQRQTEFGARG